MKSQIFRYATVVALLLATGAFLQLRARSETIPHPAPLQRFPNEIAGWQGRDVHLTANVLEVLGNGIFLPRMYESRTQPYIDFFVAYFPSQKSGDTIHSPKNCLPGAGWSPVSASQITFTSQNGRTIHADEYVIQKGIERSEVVYWYQAHGRTVASEYVAKFYLVADAIRMNRTDGALVRVVTPILGREAQSDARARALQFAAIASAQLDPYIPN